MVADFDVIVVGGGNAGLSAALSAAENGARVCVLEKAPRAWAGGNSYFTAGAFRTTFDGLDDLRSLVSLTDEEAAAIHLAPYLPDRFLADVQRVTRGRCDETLGQILVSEAREAVEWLSRHGVRWRLMFERQSFLLDGAVRFWGDLPLGAADGGPGLVAAETEAAERCGIDIRYGASVMGLTRDGGRIDGVEYLDSSGRQVLRSAAVVLASGGFEADARARAEHLGAGWDLAKVRGTPFNTGAPLFAALSEGAGATGHWSGCHAIAWDAAAPPTGDRAVSNRYSRQAYPFGITVNHDGRRFIDEGADFRNLTYARYGREILRQPGGVSFQLFDARSIQFVSTIDYDTAASSRFEAGSIRELARLMGVPRETLDQTVTSFNQSVGPGRFDPSVKDGKRTTGIQPPKSNWALPVSEPPFVGFAVTCGITFTFGGLAIDPSAAVLDAGGQKIPGLYACGELVGGLFYHNYPGGSGLTSGTVFGRRAGRSAAQATARPA